MKFEFIKEVKHEEAIKFLDLAEKRKVKVGLITEWGVVIPEKANFIVDLGDEGDKKCYIATKGFLQRSEDGIFVRLKKDGKDIKMPEFDDVFEIVDLSENHKEIMIKDKWLSEKK